MKYHLSLPALQNHRKCTAIVLLLAILLTACGNATPTPSAESVVSGVQTVVAVTLTAQVPPSATLTAAPSPTATSTTSIIPTIMTPTATAHTVTSYWPYYGCDDSAYVKDVTIPDGTVLAPGETFVKTWRFENIGSCTWTDYFLIAFVDGDDMDGSDTAIDLTVLSNKKADISVSLTAPDEEGTYTGYWQLADQYGNAFGEMVYVSIVVEEAVATSTPTPTDIYTATPIPDTLTPTVEPEITETPLPTETPTPVETPTSTSDP